MNRIKGRTAIITGATAGIGQACAHALAEMGVRLVLTGRRDARLREVAAALIEGGAEVSTYVLDVRDRDAIEAFMKWLDEKNWAPDILVNNAGLARGLDRIQDGSHEDWDEMIDTNVKGLLNMTRAVLPGMVERDHGHVVNIGSIAGRIVYPNGNVYNATKFAVRAITQATNIDLVGTRVRASSVDPGLVETEFSVVRFRGDADRAEAVYQGIDSLHPEDIADAVAYVVNTPPHVTVQEMLVMPTVQRSPYVVDRDPA
ncbi:MAG: SDR family NAD(P)-dependent oxidoreductase [Gemmatimonadetes bacterium]|nr:SDR family NAD(P)-dependent oxidoreductase [Gemmatimonadota bacterium]